MPPLEDKNYRARTQLLAVASRLFYTQGYTATGINQIIAEAGVAKASFYQHFPAKELLLEAYLEQAIEAALARMKAAVSAIAEPREQVLACFTLMTDFMESHDFRGCRFQNMLPEVPASSPRVHELIRLHSVLMRDYFAELLSPLNQQAAADAVALVYEGALISCQIYGNTSPVDTAKQLVAKLL